MQGSSVLGVGHIIKVERINPSLQKHVLHPSGQVHESPLECAPVASTQWLHGHMPAQATSTPTQCAVHALMCVILSAPHTGFTSGLQLHGGGGASDCCSSVGIVLSSQLGMTSQGHSPSHTTLTPAQFALHSFS